MNSILLRHKAFTTCIVLVLSLISTITTAADTKPFVSIGLVTGGDDLLNTVGRDFKAGGLFYFGGGLLIEPEESILMYQISMGYKVDAIKFKILNSNTSGDSIISVMPLDALVFIKANELRFGVGLTYYINPEWELCFDGSRCNTTSYDDAVGPTIELRYQANHKAFWGIRYSNVDYEIGSVSIDASNLGIYGGLSFN